MNMRKAHRVRNNSISYEGFLVPDIAVVAVDGFVGARTIARFYA